MSSTEEFKDIAKLFNEIKVVEKGDLIQFNDYPYELLNRMESLAAELSKLKPYDDYTDNDGVFVSKEGYKKLEKIVYYMNEIEKLNT